jgi:S-adenosylmethionine decarboxylase
MTHLGFHYIWDIYDCDYNAIEKVPEIQSLMSEIVRVSNLTKLSESFNQFAPHGVTGVYLLEESHLSVHTWPEKNYAALDLFSCVSLDKYEEVEHIIRKHLGNIRLDFKMVKRGEV